MEKIMSTIEILKCFERENRMYWLSRMELSDSEKGFIVINLGL